MSILRRRLGSIAFAAIKVPAKARLSAAVTIVARMQFADTAEKIQAFLTAQTKESGSKTR